MEKNGRRRPDMGRNGLWTAVWIVLLASAVAARFAQGGEISLVTSLKRYERQMLQGGATNGAFLARFIMTMNNPMNPNDGVATNNCQALWTAGLCLMSMTTEYEHPPTYRASTVRRTGGSAGGQSIVWRSREKWFVSSNQRNEWREESESYRVEPDGTIRTTHSSTMLHRQRVGDPNGNYVFDQFLRAAGRGLAPHMREILSQEGPGPGGGVGKLEAVADFPGFTNTRWRIQYEPEEDNLVREARLLREGDDNPILTVVTSGVVECAGLKLAASGTLDHGSSFTSQFRILALTSLTRDDDAFKAFHDKIMSKLDTPLPAGRSQIYDQRGPETKIVNP